MNVGMHDRILIQSMARRLIPKNEISQELKDLTDDRLRDLRRPRIVMFYKNADRYFKGKTLHITPHRYLHFEELLSDLSKSMSLPYGVRRIYTPIGGTLIEDIEELKDGESYVCASFEKFHRIKYGQYSDRNHLRYRIPNYSNGDAYGNFPHTTTGTGRSALRSTFPPSGEAMFRPTSFKAYPKGAYPQPTQSGNSPTKPKMITVVRLGPIPPYNKITILLNRRSVQTFEQLLADISEALAQPKWNGDHVRRLYTLKGREVRSVSDFFREDDVFIAVGKEQLTAVDIQDVMQELYPESPYTENLIRLNLQKSYKHQNQSKRYSDRTKGSKTDSLSGDSMRFVDDQQRSGRKYRSRHRLVVDQRVKEQERMKAKQWERQRWEREKEELDEELRRRHGDLDLADDDMDQSQRDNARRKKERLQWNLKEQKKKQLEEEQREEERREKERIRREQAAESERQIKRLEEQLKRERLREENEIKKRQKEEDERREWEEQRRQAELERERRRLEEELKCLENEKRRARDQERQLKEEQGKRKREEEENRRKRNQNEEHDSEKGNHLDRKGLPPPSHVTNKADDTDRLRKIQKFKAPPRRIITRGEIESRYEIGRIIGDGNFAVVRECRLRNTESEFAMKIIDKSKLKEKVSMIENEIAIMKNCRHPNIVRLIEEFETKDEIYLILEYIKGGDLFDAITESVKFTERDAANMVADLSEALKFLHSRNIVHRDLKPENLLVSRNKDGSMTLKLADFGLAMEVTEPIYTVCGTPTYVAPEILAETGYGHEVDMWAVGVITYILLCGFPPFRSIERDQEELFEIIQLGDYEFLSPYWDSISQAAKDLIQRLLVVDTKRRYTAEQVLSHAWIQSEGAYKGPNLQREITMNLEKNFGSRGYRKGNHP